MHQVSYRDYLDFRDRSKSFDGLVAMTLQSFGLSEKADALPQRKVGLLVSGNFFRALGVEPSMGRGFRDDEDKVPGRDRVVVLSHDLWVNQFDGEPGRGWPANSIERNRVHDCRSGIRELHGGGPILPARAVHPAGNGAGIWASGSAGEPGRSLTGRERAD